MVGQRALSPDELGWTCDDGIFGFKTTEEIPALPGVIGQERALKAIDFGLGIDNHSYNMFVLGPGGTGKESILKSIIEEKAKNEEVPDDWCYVFNFADPDRPEAINLPPGWGSMLCENMDDLIESLRRDIPKVFESKDYEKHRDEIIEGQQERTRALFFRLEQKAAERGLMLKKSVSGLAVVPSKNGKALSQEEFESLDRDKRSRIEEDMKVMQDRLSDTIREARAIEKETKERINALDREVVQYVVNPIINDVVEKFKGFEQVTRFVQKVQGDVLANIEELRPKDEPQFQIPGLPVRREPAFDRYRVNLVVNNKETQGAPVVFEPNPTYYNLFGRIEYRVQFGVATTDFTMIKAGSVHRANGGYLVINALDMLRNIFAYDSIKRMIKNREARIEDVWEQYRLVSSSTLKPAPMPVDIKVVLIGEPYVYYLLYNLDSDYRKLFKVKADFDGVMPMTEDNIRSYALFVAAQCKDDELLPFDPSGVARVVEFGCRLSGDREKLSARFNEVRNLVIEADYWAGVDKVKTVSREHVERAYKERVYRNSRIEERLREFITQDTIMVDTVGKVAGQVNGMAVLDPGDYAFGKPSRVTARTFMGDAGVVNIEREVKMSGRIHNKALLILTSFIGNRFAREFPLTLSASVTFEQLYDEVEGDSATCTEVYALLSAISGLPLDQGIAVTGSMNQMGAVQPVGGVNEKIEGFFDTCVAKGLTGSQGVIIPRRNVRNLQLKKEVVDAVKQGKFAIYPIETVDEGMEILTGVPAGELGADNAYPEGTINFFVEQRLKSLARGFKDFGKVQKRAVDVSNDNAKQEPKDAK